MTLIVSLRIPDGIVIAGDSLASMIGNLQAKTNVEVECPNCGQRHEVAVELPPINLPMTTFAYAQKIFPFMDKFGVGTSGQGQLAGKTIYFAARELEESLRNNNSEINEVEEAAQLIGSHFHQLLRDTASTEGVNIDEMPPEWKPLGFQVVGYQKGQSTSIEVQLGREMAVNSNTGPGVTVIGNMSLVNILFEYYRTNEHESPIVDLFSLQDAIEYAEFLINTTAKHQQFSRNIPNVGGNVDIALITPFDDYKWIKQKSLSELLGGKHATKSG